MADLFQDFTRSQILSDLPIATALAAGTIVKVGSTGWTTAADETEAQGILMVDAVAAPASDSDGVSVYSGGVVGAPAKIYVGSEGPVDVGDCECLTPVIDDADNYTVGSKVYVGNGILYSTAQNSGSAIGVVTGIDGERIKVSFKFVV
jgi:hypothetical protein